MERLSIRYRCRLQFIQGLCVNLKEYIGYCTEILDTNEMIYIGSDFTDEYAHSKDTKVLRGPNEYAKANASAAIKELIQIAQNKTF